MTIRSPTASSTRSASCVSWSGPRRRPSVRCVNSRSRAPSTTCDPSRIRTSRPYNLRADELTSDATRMFRYRTTLTTGVRHRQELHELRHRMLLQRPSHAMLHGPFGRTGQAATSEFRQRINATGMRVKELVPTNGRPPRYMDTV